MPDLSKELPENGDIKPLPEPVEIPARQRPRGILTKSHCPDCDRKGVYTRLRRVCRLVKGKFIEVHRACPICKKNFTNTATTLAGTVDLKALPVLVAATDQVIKPVVYAKDIKQATLVAIEAAKPKPVITVSAVEEIDL